MTPRDFMRIDPMDSVAQNSDAEDVARNIMVILARTGNVWRNLSWEEYESERAVDGKFAARRERHYFNHVIDYCESEQTARVFSPAWKLARLGGVPGGLR